MTAAIDLQRQKLPIDDHIPHILETLRTTQNLLLHAPPGAGKSTRVPLALLDIFTPGAGSIIMLEPRRLAAVSAARWMAHSLGEEVGRTVGYSIRFDSKVSRETRIEVVTEAILTRRIQSDPLLEGVAMVIFDEFHERSIHADLGVALCLDIQRQVRPDLKILVMSATLECEALAELMGATVISSGGRSYPVEDVYLEDHSTVALPERMAAAIILAIGQNEGDILAFLPGTGEIRSCYARLAESGLAERGIIIHQLYGDLPFELQQAAIMPDRKRKVVLATSIAESSLTIEGVRVVIDSGLSRRIRYDLSSGMNRLVTVRESRSSAEQRKGRAGRVAPGVCYRLFSRHTFGAMTEHTPPEILDTDLSPLLLELASWGVNDPALLPWLDMPPAAALEAARCLLIELSALDDSACISSLGSAMARLPLHPRLSRLLLRASEIGCIGIGCDLSALLSGRDIIRRTPPVEAGGRRLIDISERVELLREWRNTGCSDPSLDTAALKSVEQVSRQLLRLLKSDSGLHPESDFTELVSRLLLSAYPDRVAKQRSADSGQYLLANGRGSRMASAGAVSGSGYLVAVSVHATAKADDLIHLAEPVSLELLRDEFGLRIKWIENITWDSCEGRVAAVREERLGSIILSSRSFVPDTEALLTVVIGAVRASNLVLLARDEGFFQLQARVNLLRRCFPGDGWPDMTEAALLETLDVWLAPAISGIRNAHQLSLVNSSAALLNSLKYSQKQTLEKLAPTHVVVPTGSRIRLDYCSGEHPVLAVKLQELFGLADTPVIAGGREPVQLHLLSPAGRPLQVTMDLKGFWDGSYHQVKKEMKGRYPKHPWPDDPWSAPPTRRAKPKAI